MAKRHERIDQVAAEFGWEPVGSFAAAGDVGGRRGAFSCSYLTGTDAPAWTAGVSWGEQMSRRERKQAARRKDEILTAYLTPKLEATLQGYRGVLEKNTTMAESLNVSKGLLYFESQPNPPPSKGIATIIHRLSDLASRFETLP